LRPASDGQSEKHPVAVRAPWVERPDSGVLRQFALFRLSDA